MLTSTTPFLANRSPLEARDHVEQSVIPRGVILVLGTQSRVRQKPERPHPVSDAHQHHSLPGQPLATVVWLRSGARVETAAINPNQNGNAIVGGFRRRPHIQVQAILTRRGTRIGAGHPHPLNAFWSELRRCFHSVPDRKSVV